MKRSVFIFLLSIFLLSASHSHASEIGRLVETAKKCIANKEFEELTTMFLYPESYSEGKVNDEIRNISENLHLLSKEFGSFDKLTELSNEEFQSFIFSVAGGDIEFLKKNPNYIQATYKTNFSKVGPGYITIEVYPNNNKPMLRGVGYALIASEKNLPLAKKISSKLMALMNSRAPSKEI